jgi:hypothetical protein
MEAGLLQPRAQLDSKRRGRSGVAVIERVRSTEPYMKLAGRLRCIPLIEASQLDVLDRPANSPAIARTRPPPTNGVIVDSYLLVHNPSDSIPSIQ